MIFGSVCSGIEAASVAWHPLGWKSSFYSEIELFPRAVLSHHYPTIPLHGDFTTIKASMYEPIDLLAGGTPCQSFSIAGLRKGFDDDRGNLSLEFIRLASRLSPRWLVWENVPGVLSSNKGRDFGAFLGGLAECGYGFAYRVLDAQYFGVPQRRRRVIVVGYFGDWRPAAAVLFERESLRGDITPRQKEGQRIADSLTVGANQYSGFCGEPVESEHLIAKCLTSRGAGGLNQDPETSNFIVDTLTSSGDANSGFRDAGGLTYNHKGARRLTPRECERLQGFPDDYTLIPFNSKMATDSPRYKALGNSWATPKFKWIGERINLIEAIKSSTKK